MDVGRFDVQDEGFEMSILGNSVVEFDSEFEEKVLEFAPVAVYHLMILKKLNYRFRDWEFSTEMVHATPENKMRESNAWLLQKRIGLSRFFGFIFNEVHRIEIRIILSTANIDWHRQDKSGFVISARASSVVYPRFGAICSALSSSTCEEETITEDQLSILPDILDNVIHRFFG